MIKAVLFDMDGTLIDTEKYLTVYKQKVMMEDLKGILTIL